MAKYVINAGHTKLGKGTGAVGLLNESIETRKIVCELMSLLADTKHEIIPAIFDKSDNNLKEAVNLANNEKADLFISVHLNAGGGQGSECYTWKGNKVKQASSILTNLEKIGFKNRGIKNGSHLYVIKNTKATAILVECCFVDNTKDKEKYNAYSIAKCIYNAIK